MVEGKETRKENVHLRTRFAGMIIKKIIVRGVVLDKFKPRLTIK